MKQSPHSWPCKKKFLVAFRFEPATFGFAGGIVQWVTTAASEKKRSQVQTWGKQKFFIFSRISTVYPGRRSVIHVIKCKMFQDRKGAGEKSVSRMK